MTLWDKLMALKDALNYGEKLQDSAVWKDKAILSTLIAGVLACIVPFVPELQALDQAVVRDFGLNLGWGLYAVFGLYNAYVHTATSDSVGFKQRSGDPSKQSANKYKLCILI